MWSLLLVTAMAQGSLAPCVRTFARGVNGDGTPPYSLICDTYRRLLTELHDPVVKDRHVKEFARMLEHKKWLTPEVRNRMRVVAELVEQEKIPARAHLHEMASENEQRSFLFPSSFFDSDTISANGRWVAYSRYVNQDRHQMFGDLETGEIFDLGSTDGDWAYLRLNISTAGDAIGIPWAHGDIKMLTHRFPKGQPRFDDSLKVFKSFGWSDFLFSSDETSTAPEYTLPGFHSDQWLVKYHSPAALYVFDAAKNTGHALSLRRLGATPDRVAKWGVVPGTDRLFFLIGNGGGGSTKPWELWTARLLDGGGLKDARRITKWPADKGYRRKLVWAQGEAHYHFDPDAPANLKRVTTDGTTHEVPLESPFGPESKLVVVRVAKAGNLDLIFADGDGRRYQPAHYDLATGRLTWTAQNRISSSQHVPFFTGDGKRIVFQPDVFHMESRLLVPHDAN